MAVKMKYVPGEQLQHALERFTANAGYDKSTLCAALNVSRPTLNKWMAGGTQTKITREGSSCWCQRISVDHMRAVNKLHVRHFEAEAFMAFSG